jgi:hypothetical protein
MHKQLVRDYQLFLLLFVSFRLLSLLPHAGLS